MWPLFCNDSQTPNIIYFLTQRVYKGTHFYNVAPFSVRQVFRIYCVISNKLFMNKQEINRTTEWFTIHVYTKSQTEINLHIDMVKNGSL